MLGIGISSYNRRESLSECIAHVRANTREPYVLVVADDGSEDGTADYCKAAGIPCIAGKNRGIDWNRNRLIFALWRVCACDPVILLEDDARPYRPGWEAAWIEGAQRWGHVCWAYNETAVEAGMGTPADPYWGTHFGTQCVASSAGALRRVGYTDPSFYGCKPSSVGHVDWTGRFASVYGSALRWSGPCPLLNVGVGAEFGHTYYSQESSAASQIIRHALMDSDHVWRPPFYSDEHARAFAEEMLPLCRIDDRGRLWPPFCHALAPTQQEVLA